MVLVFVMLELYEICLLRAKDKLKLLKESAGDTDSITSGDSLCLVDHCLSCTFSTTLLGQFFLHNYDCVKVAITKLGL